MKLQALTAAVLLAFGAGAFAQATPATPATPASPSESAATPATPATPAAPEAKAGSDEKKVAAKSKTRKAKKSTAKAKKSTQSMGAGPASPVTDLEATDRQARIDQAYANWQAQQPR